MGVRKLRVQQEIAARLQARRERLARIVVPLRQTSPEDLGWIVGTPAAVAAKLRALEAAGADLAILGHYDLDDADTLDLIAYDVLPAVQ